MSKNIPYDEQKLRAYKFYASLGVVSIPLLSFLLPVIPHIIIMAGALIAGPNIASNEMKPESLLPYISAFYTGLVGFAGIICMYFIAPIISTNQSLLPYNLDLYISTALISLYNAYYTQNIIDKYNSGDRNDVIQAYNYANPYALLLDIINRIKKNY